MTGKKHCQALEVSGFGRVLRCELWAAGRAGLGHGPALDAVRRSHREQCRAASGCGDWLHAAAALGLLDWRVRVLGWGGEEGERERERRGWMDGWMGVRRLCERLVSELRCLSLVPLRRRARRRLEGLRERAAVGFALGSQSRRPMSVRNQQPKRPPRSSPLQNLTD